MFLLINRNIVKVWVEKVRGVLIDWHIATKFSSSSSSSKTSNVHLSGTFLFLSLLSHSHTYTLSGDCESLFYCFLSIATEFQLPWRNSFPVELMYQNKWFYMTFDWKKTLRSCKPEFRDIVQRLHGMFFNQVKYLTSSVDNQLNFAKQVREIFAKSKTQ